MNTNEFGVRRTKAGIQVSGYAGEPLSDEEALDLVRGLIRVATVPPSQSLRRTGDVPPWFAKVDSPPPWSSVCDG